MFYLVFRYNISKTGQEAHSEQRFETETQALKRFYNILAADIDSENLEYEFVQVVNSASGGAIKNQVFDFSTPEPEPEPSAE